MMRAGELAPWFRTRAIGGATNYTFHTVAGRHVLLLFMRSALDPAGQAALALVSAHRALFDDVGACFFGVTRDPDDETAGRVRPSLPGIRFFADQDGAIVQAFRPEAEQEAADSVAPGWVLLDPMLRIVGEFPLEAGEDSIAALQAVLGSLAADHPDWAPVLMIPNVLDAATCGHLIALHEREGGEESGVHARGGRENRHVDGPEA